MSLRRIFSEKLNTQQWRGFQIGVTSFKVIEYDSNLKNMYDFLSLCHF